MATNILLKDIAGFSKIALDYADYQDVLKPYFSSYCTIDSFIEQIESRKTYSLSKRALLYKSLKAQYIGINPTDVTNANLELLKQENTFTITTGHQLCLFTGPLYFIYKIVTTINLCKQLQQQYPEHNFIPVYWMASEDHDFEEVNHVHLFGKKLEWETEAKGPVGFLQMKSLKPLLEELFKILGDGNQANTLKEIITKCYAPEKTLAEATLSFVNELFGKHGLVIIDANNAELKSAAKDLFKKEILNRSSEEIVLDTSNKLKGLGYAAAVTPRPINLFYQNESFRKRLLYDEENYRYNVINTDISFSEDEILSELDNHPKKFSPNVVLRPLYQELILPSLAYIGGPSEVAYWLQLKSLFAHHKITYPIVCLRNMALILNSKQKLKIKELGLEVKDLMIDDHELSKKIVQSQSDNEISLQNYIMDMIPIFDRLKSQTNGIDASLSAKIEAEQAKLNKFMDQLEKRLVKTLKQKEEIKINQALKLKQTLFPNNSLQERHDNFIPFYLKYGDDFIDQLLESFDPFVSELSILEMN